MMRFVLLRAVCGDVHVVNPESWVELGSPPRTRCGLRVGDQWVTVASTDSPADVRKTDCCEECRRVLLIRHRMSSRWSSVKPSPVRRAA